MVLRSFVRSFYTNSDTFGVCLLSLVYPGWTNEGRGKDDLGIRKRERMKYGGWGWGEEKRKNSKIKRLINDFFFFFWFLLFFIYVGSQNTDIYGKWFSM